MIGSQYRPNDGHRRYPAATDNRFQIVFIKTADGDHRPAHPSQHLHQPIDPDRGVGIGLARSGEYRPEAEVIGSFGISLESLLQRVGRAADHHAGTNQAAGLGQGQIILPQMESVGFDQQGDIGPVVNHERGFETAAKLPDLPGFPEKIPVAAAFAAPLEDIDPDLQHLFKIGKKIITGIEFLINDEIESGPFPTGSILIQGEPLADLPPAPPQKPGFELIQLKPQALDPEREIGNIRQQLSDLFQGPGGFLSPFTVGFQQGGPVPTRGFAGGKTATADIRRRPAAGQATGVQITGFDQRLEPVTQFLEV